MDSDWDDLLKFMKVYPDIFDPSKCTFEEYKRFSSFISTRCFGWGLPTTFLAPIADSFNHNCSENNLIDFINKRLHLTENKIYAYHHNYNKEIGEEGSTEDDIYEKSSSKYKYNVE